MTVRLGTPISAYGQESRNRAARQRIPHRAYTDSDGVEHHHVIAARSPLQPPKSLMRDWSETQLRVALQHAAHAHQVHAEGPSSLAHPICCTRMLCLADSPAWPVPQIQFHAKGPSNSAVVNCSMYQDSGKQWQYDLLFLDFGGPVRQRIFLEGQQHQ